MKRYEDYTFNELMELDEEVREELEEEAIERTNKRIKSYDDLSEEEKRWFDICSANAFREVGIEDLAKMIGNCELQEWFCYYLADMGKIHLLYAFTALLEEEIKAYLED